MEILIFGLGFFVILPMLISANIAQKRNRSVDKAVFVTFFFGWLATILIWLMLVDHSAFTKNDFDNVVKKLRNLDIENERNKANN